MNRGVPFVPLVVVAAMVLVPSGYASHLSMDMPGLGGAAVPPASFALLATAAIAALIQGLWLLASARLLPRSPWARDAAWVLALAPLGVSAARTVALSSSAGGGEIGARIAEVGRAGSEHMWALLCALALGVGFGAARTLELGIEWRARESAERARFPGALAALVLTGPLVGLILATSTGVDWISSWIRWSGCGLAAIVCAGSALVPGRGEVLGVRVLGGTTFVLAVAFSLLAEREYVEALGHDALAHRDPFDPAVEWARGLAEIAAAVEPRERYGLFVALLPWIALAPGVSWRAVSPRLASGLLVMAAGVVFATAISSRLDQTAVLAAGQAAPLAIEEPAEIVWSNRALPRTAPWLRAIRQRSAPAPREPRVSPVHCAAWMAPMTPDG